jgi:hypothetical protein
MTYTPLELTIGQPMNFGHESIGRHAGRIAGVFFAVALIDACIIGAIVLRGYLLIAAGLVLVRIGQLVAGGH